MQLQTSIGANQSVALLKKEPSNLAEKMRYKHLTEQDYDCALEDQIVVLVKDAVKNFDENAYCNGDAFDYKAYFLSRIRREYPFLKYVNLEK